MSAIDPQIAILSLYKAIVIRAIKDYQYRKYKPEVIDWVVDMQEMFPMCAEAMNLNQWELRSMMVNKMIDIDTLGTVCLYGTVGEVRMRK